MQPINEKMKLKTKFLIYISVIHAIFLIVTLVIYRYNKGLFIFCEAALLSSLLLIIGFYNTIFRSFRLLHAGIESINDKDFSLKFLPPGEPEIDRLVVVYNNMIDQLRLERVKTTEKNFFLEKLIEASPVATIIMDKNNEILYAGTDGGAYVSFDAGATWGQINDGLVGSNIIYSIAVDNESNVYAATPYGVFKLEVK